MKRTLALPLLLLASATAFGGMFTAGDLVVVTVGNGSSLNGNAMTGALYEYTTSGTQVQTINLPATASGANGALTFSGSATSEGFLHLSTDGNYLTLAGYNATLGTASPQSAAPSTIARTVGVVSIWTGNINTTTLLGDAYNASNIRSVASTDGFNLWTSGNGGSGLGASAGNRYTTLGSTTSVQLNSTTSNNRANNIYNGQLYASAASGSIQGVATVGTGLPTTSGQALTILPGMPTTTSHSSYDFWFKDANTLYVADDGTAANGGGIQKWTFNGTTLTWSLQYTLLNTGAATTGCRGLTGQIDGNGNADLFATTTASTANTLIEVIDTGAGATATVLATAPTGDAFRGVALIPEPSGFALAGLGLLVLAAFRRLRR